MTDEYNSDLLTRDEYIQGRNLSAEHRVYVEKAEYHEYFTEVEDDGKGKARGRASAGSGKKASEIVNKLNIATSIAQTPQALLSVMSRLLPFLTTGALAVTIVVAMSLSVSFKLGNAGVDYADVQIEVGELSEEDSLSYTVTKSGDSNVLYSGTLTAGVSTLEMRNLESATVYVADVKNNGESVKQFLFNTLAPPSEPTNKPSAPVNAPTELTVTAGSAGGTATLTLGMTWEKPTAGSDGMKLRWTVYDFADTEGKNPLRSGEIGYDALSVPVRLEGLGRGAYAAVVESVYTDADGKETVFDIKNEDYFVISGSAPVNAPKDLAINMQRSGSTINIDVDMEWESSPSDYGDVAVDWALYDIGGGSSALAYRGLASRALADSPVLSGRIPYNKLSEGLQFDDLTDGDYSLTVQAVFISDENGAAYNLGEPVGRFFISNANAPVYPPYGFGAIAAASEQGTEIRFSLGWMKTELDDGDVLINWTVSDDSGNEIDSGRLYWNDVATPVLLTGLSNGVYALEATLAYDGPNGENAIEGRAALQFVVSSDLPRYMPDGFTASFDTTGASPALTLGMGWTKDISDKGDVIARWTVKDSAGNVVASGEQTMAELGTPIALDITRGRYTAELLPVYKLDTGGERTLAGSASQSLLLASAPVNAPEGLTVAASAKEMSRILTLAMNWTADANDFGRVVVKWTLKADGAAEDAAPVSSGTVEYADIAKEIVIADLADGKYTAEARAVFINADNAEFDLGLAATAAVVKSATAPVNLPTNLQTLPAYDEYSESSPFMFASYEWIKTDADAGSVLYKWTFTGNGGEVSYGDYRPEDIQNGISLNPDGAELPRGWYTFEMNAWYAVDGKEYEIEGAESCSEDILIGCFAPVNYPIGIDFLSTDDRRVVIPYVDGWESSPDDYGTLYIRWSIMDAKETELASGQIAAEDCLGLSDYPEDAASAGVPVVPEDYEGGFMVVAWGVFVNDAGNEFWLDCGGNHQGYAGDAGPVNTPQLTLDFSENEAGGTTARPIIGIQVDWEASDLDIGTISAYWNIFDGAGSSVSDTPADTGSVDELNTYVTPQVTYGHNWKRGWYTAVLTANYIWETTDGNESVEVDSLTVELLKGCSQPVFTPSSIEGRYGEGSLAIMIYDASVSDDDYGTVIVEWSLEDKVGNVVKSGSFDWVDCTELDGVMAYNIDVSGLGAGVYTFNASAKFVNDAGEENAVLNSDYRELVCSDLIAIGSIMPANMPEVSIEFKGDPFSPTPKPNQPYVDFTWTPSEDDPEDAGVEAYYTVNKYAESDAPSLVCEDYIDPGNTALKLTDSYGDDIVVYGSSVDRFWYTVTVEVYYFIGDGLYREKIITESETYYGELSGPYNEIGYNDVQIGFSAEDSQIYMSIANWEPSENDQGEIEASISISNPELQTPQVISFAQSDFVSDGAGGVRATAVNADAAQILANNGQAGYTIYFTPTDGETTSYMDSRP